MKKICFILFLFTCVTSYSQTFWYPVWLKSTVKMTGIPGTGTLLGIDVSGNVSKVLGVGAGGVTGLNDYEPLFGSLTGLIEQDNFWYYDPTIQYMRLGDPSGSAGGEIAITDGATNTSITQSSMTVSGSVGQTLMDGQYFSLYNLGSDLFSIGRATWSVDEILLFPAAKGALNQSLQVSNVTGDEVTLSWYTPTSGEVNTASNLGGGLANFDSKSGVDLRFNSFLASDFNLGSNLISLDYTNAQKATTSTIGFLTDTDWDTFNDKVSFDIHSQASETSLANDDEIPIYDLSEGAINKTTYETLLSPNPTNYRNYRFIYFNEFLNTVGTATGGNDIIATNSGTGAGTNNTATTAAERVGLVRSTTGTTATGRTSPGTSSTACAFGGGSWTYEIEINLAALSTVTQRYQLVLGFHDVQNAANQIDAIAFVYDEGGVSTGSAASANWQTLTSSNSTRTWTTSGTAVATGWVNLRIEVNAAGNSVSFYVNGSSIATHTTNIPTGTTRVSGFGYLMIKSIGTTASTMDVDYIFCEQDLTTNR